MNKIIIGIVVLLAVGVGAYFIMQSTGSSYESDIPEVTPDVVEVEEVIDVEPAEEVVIDKTKTILGSSVNGAEITAYHYGDLDAQKEVLLVGGIHGGYSVNTSALMYEVMDRFSGDGDGIPAGLKVTVVPLLNPDGVQESFGTSNVAAVTPSSVALANRVDGRFNANGVDLNRNFNCLWEEEGTWQNKSVSGGSAPFSEPESKAIQGYVEANTPDAVVVWYSAAGGVYASNCKGGVMAETTELTNAYADASGYTANEEFDFYEITGDMVNWLAAKNIPAISVLLTDHNKTELSKNTAGIDAVLKSVAQ